MFLKSLTISSEDQIIREINFRNGINLIVDETPTSESKTESGNNVGKTTVLKLIDFCFGANAKSVYLDQESKKEYQLVKDFLKEKKILITLVLKKDLDNPSSQEIVIERNFLSGKKEVIRRINHQQITDENYQTRLQELLFPEHEADKPTVRQIISHNFRFEDQRINQTLRTLDKFSTDAEYETLHLFLLGCDVSSGNEKQDLLSKIHQEHTFKDRLEKNQTRIAYETALALVESDIEKLNKKKANLQLNENFEEDLNKLDSVKYQIGRISYEISKANVRRDVILEAQQELEADFSSIDTQQLQIIYQQATDQISGIQKSFEDLVNFHNKMVAEKVKFITQELPELENTIQSQKAQLKSLLEEEEKLSHLIAKSNTYEDLEKLVSELNEKFRKKGEYENIIQQLSEVEKEIERLTGKLQKN